MSGQGYSELTLKQIVTQMPVKQLWGLILIIVGLVTGAFTLGYKISSSVSEYKVADLQSNANRLEGEKKTLDDQLKKQGMSAEYDKKVARIKMTFFTHYVRYIIAKERANTSSTPANQLELDNSRKMFVDLISKWWRDSSNSENQAYIELQGVTVTKEGPRSTESKVTFGNDDSWLIPPEIKQEVINRPAPQQ